MDCGEEEKVTISERKQKSGRQRKWSLKKVLAFSTSGYDGIAYEWSRFWESTES